MARRKRLKKAKKRRIKIIKISLVLVFLATLVSLILGGGLFVACAKDLPNLEDQSLGKNAQTSKMYAADGTLIADLFVEQNRIIVPLEEISPSMQQATIAIEDERFYKHGGIDIEAIGRAVFINIKQGRIVEGASTITQQYVKNTFITPERTIIRKVKEVILAYQVEKKYSKKTILEKYLNTIYFGHSCYGVETSAETFFGKPAKDLTLPESALLAGLVKSPYAYSPYINPAKAQARRDEVLKKMLELKYISKQQFNQAVNTPVAVQPLKQKTTISPYFVDYVKQQFFADKRFGQTPSERANMLFKGGLRIYTTIDLRVQAAAEAAPLILNRPDDPTAALVAIDPKTGYIRALVGGKDFNVNKFNLATQGKRQPGSSFKIFTLATALEQGRSPDDTYDSSSFNYHLPGKDWHVSNATEGEGGGKMTIREGTVHSVNAVYARMIQDVGPENVVNMAHRMGITSYIPPYPSITLGTAEVTPLEMASAASTLANNGVHNQPITVAKITDARGKVILENAPQGEEVLTPSIAYTETGILKEVISRGTGRNANIGRPAAGKTGTTNSFQDAWFVGYTPDLATAVWVGYPQAQIAMYSVHGMRVQGGSFPAQIWARFMEKALENSPESDFEKVSASSSKGIRICKESGLLATQFCPETVTRNFSSEDMPTKYCTIHKGATVPSVVGTSSSTAIRTLEDAGFRVTQVNRTSSLSYGTVISQSPSGYSRAAQSSVVTIFVSKGSTKAIVPSVINMGEWQARSTVSGAGLNPVVQYVSSPSQAGKVVNQSPSAGSERNQGSQVVIVVATS